jgi:hypothetical protein
MRIIHPAATPVDLPDLPPHDRESQNIAQLVAQVVQRSPQPPHSTDALATRPADLHIESSHPDAPSASTSLIHHQHPGPISPHILSPPHSLAHPSQSPPLPSPPLAPDQTASIQSILAAAQQANGTPHWNLPYMPPHQPSAGSSSSRSVRSLDPTCSHLVSLTFVSRSRAFLRLRPTRLASANSKIRT